MAPMWSGVVPQQPPTMFTRPSAANSYQAAGDVGRFVKAGVAHRVEQTGVGVAADEGVRRGGQLLDVGRISAAPSAQFRPTDSGLAWRTLCQKAVTVWPEGCGPGIDAVPLIMMGRHSPLCSNASSMANSAALALRVSKMVSTSNVGAAESGQGLFQIRGAHLLEVDVARAGGSHRG